MAWVQLQLWDACGMSFTLHSQCLVVFPLGFSSTLRRALNCSIWNCLTRPTGLARTYSGWRKINVFTFLTFLSSPCALNFMWRMSFSPEISSDRIYKIIVYDMLIGCKIQQITMVYTQTPSTDIKTTGWISINGISSLCRLSAGVPKVLRVLDYPKYLECRCTHSIWVLV